MSNFLRNKFVIFGAGAFGREIGSMIETENLGSVLYACQEKEVEKLRNQIEIHKLILENSYIPSNHGLPVVTVGNAHLRKKIVESIRSNYPNIEFPSILSKKSYIGKRVEIGEGTIVTCNCVVTCDVKIGSFVNLNLSTTIGHDVLIDDYVTTAPGVHINGNVSVGTGSYFGSNSATVENISIPPNTVLGAGAVIVKNISESGTYVGAPAKILRR